MSLAAYNIKSLEAHISVIFTISATLIKILIIPKINFHWNILNGTHKPTPGLLKHIHVHKVTPSSYIHGEDDGEVAHAPDSLSWATEELGVHRSSSCIIKSWLDLAHKYFPFHLTEMKQEAVLPALTAGCGGSRSSAGSCCTNGCLHNSLSATRT